MAHPSTPSMVAALVEPLTSRELEILGLFEQRLSNREIADRLYLTVGTVKWYAQQIFQKLGVSDRRQAVAEAQRLRLLEQAANTPEVTTPQAAFVAVSHNLPAALTSFVGREAEVAEVQRLLASHRLVTLTGPGGMGKTRLAIQSAAQLVDTYADGVRLVALAPVARAEQVLPAIAEVLDLRPAADEPLLETLCYHLSTRTLLLVLDNFEHVMSAAAHLVALLGAAPGLRLLVTSRTGLHIPGECEYPVPPLEIPEALPQDPGDLLAASPAVALFTERAQAVRPDFVLTPAEMHAVVDICRQVQGMPLALELAASWSELLTPAEIAAEIRRNLDFLEVEWPQWPERQRSMRAIFETSWRLLGTEERALFQRLTVFEHGFTREAAQAVTGISLRQLLALVNKSWLQSAADGRHVAHELLRQYALLEAEPALRQDSQARHAAYFAEFVVRQYDRLRGPDQVAAARAFADDLDNVIAAWHWHVAQGRIEVLVQKMLPGLLLFCALRSVGALLGELVRGAQAALPAPPRQLCRQTAYGHSQHCPLRVSLQ